jgi:TRAP-type transport system periplasmic protein
MMKRSRFLAGTVVTAGTFGVISSKAKAAEFTFKLGHPWPEEYFTNKRLVQMASAVKAETAGRMEIQIFPNSALGAQTGQIAQLRMGAEQLLCMNHSVYATVVPVSQICAVGFAFNTEKQPIDALDGALGDYIRKQFTAQGMYVFEKTFDNAFRQITTSTHPIRTVDDFAGLKLRTLPAPIFVDLFKNLGASPIPIDSSEQYVSMQTHIVDGEDSGLDLIESAKYYEVQKYLSITNHIWGGAWLAANSSVWNALPRDVQAIVNRNVTKFTLLQRQDVLRANDTLVASLKRHGMIVNTAETTSMRARLGAYYARWKNEFGPTAWSLLEAKAGKLA